MPGLIEFVIPGGHKELHVVISVLAAVDPARARINFIAAVIERISDASGERGLGAFRPWRYVVPGRQAEIDEPAVIELQGSHDSSLPKPRVRNFPFWTGLGIRLA